MSIRVRNQFSAEHAQVNVFVHIERAEFPPDCTESTGRAKSIIPHPIFPLLKLRQMNINTHLGMGRTCSLNSNRTKCFGAMSDAGEAAERRYKTKAILA